MLVGFIYSIPPDSVAEYDTPGEDIRLIHGPSKSIITSIVVDNKAGTVAFSPNGAPLQAISVSSGTVPVPVREFSEAIFQEFVLLSF